MTDLLVVGGGPVGLAVAIRAAMAGMSVQVLEARRPPLDKACGEGLMPDGVECLSRMGVELSGEQHAVFHGIRYIDELGAAEARFPGEGGLGVRRPVLHSKMVERATSLGVDLIWGTRVKGAVDQAVQTEQGEFRAKWVVGADGLHSRMRAWWGLEGRRVQNGRFGVRRHFRLDPWTDLVEVHWAAQCEAYVTPVAANEIGVALLWSGARSGFDELITRFPDLVGRLRGAEISSDSQGAGPLEQRVRVVCDSRRALVGDAAGYLDAITGEGLSVGFHQAVALVDAVESGDLRRYQKAHAGVMRVPLTLTRLLLMVERRPSLRARLIRVLAQEPGLFERLLGVHARQLPPRAVTGRDLMRLALGLMTCRRPRRNEVPQDAETGREAPDSRL